MNTILFLFVGLVAALPLLIYANKLSFRASNKLLGISLVLAALIYIGFALAWGDMRWLFIEIAGVAIYGGFFLLANKQSRYWLAIGWLLHPVWDIALHLHGPGEHIVPLWYALACVSFDAIVAAYLLRRIYKYQSNSQSDQN